MKARAWLIQYGVAIVLAVLLGLVLGHVPLFKEATLGKLRASDFVQFLGYGGALVMVWLCGRHLASHLPQDWKGIAPFKDVILPVTTLLVMGNGYGVVNLICEPYLEKTGKSLYNWLFVVGLVGASCWLIVSWFMKSAPLVASLDAHRRGRRQAA
ncbi:MAG: hypothetical protein ACT4OO_01285 [Nitrospiraceae bacterium]